MSERLTTRLANGGVGYDNGEYFKVCYPWNENCLTDIDRMAIRLCELEDKIEQGDVVEVRHGEWKKFQDLYPRYVCTSCNHLYNNKEYKYCPNCGAKMDGERKEEK